MTRTVHAGAVLLGVLVSGCTNESTRIAIETQRRADEVQQAVFDRQHEALRILLYREALRRVEGAGASLSAEQRDALNAIWNERDLLEFWAVQHERAAALRMLGVDAKLYGDQETLDLLWKNAEKRMDRARRGLLIDAAENATARAAAEAAEPRAPIRGRRRDAAADGGSSQ